MTATTEPPGLPAGPWTAADLEGMPDDGHRYELLDGTLIVSPAPRARHQIVVGRLFRLLDDAGPAGVLVLFAPFAVRPNGPDSLRQTSTELQPDVLVAREVDVTEKDLPVAPLLAVEVLSPSTRLVDLNLKKAAYERMGAPSFWAVDPDAAELWAYQLDDQGCYQQVAHVVGEQVFEATQPFPVNIRPADLIRRRRSA